MRKSGFEESHLLFFFFLLFYFFFPIVCQALTKPAPTCAASTSGRKAYPGGLSSRRRGHKAAGGTAVSSGGDVEPCSCQARSDAPCSCTSCSHQGARYFLLPLLVAGEPLGMLMPCPVSSGKLLPCMNKELRFELGSVGSFPALIRQALGLGLGFVFPSLFVPSRPICRSEPTPKAPAG